VPLQENDYPPPAIQNRADICAINAIVIGKSDLASLTGQLRLSASERRRLRQRQMRCGIWRKTECNASRHCWFTWFRAASSSITVNTRRMAQRLNVNAWGFQQ
jgi:hypothetical protein